MATFGHFNMTFYDSLGVFKTISGDFDFFEFVWTPPPLNYDRDDRNMAKTSKIRQNTCFGGQNAVNSCQKVPKTPFFRASIIFLSSASDSSSNFGLKKCINSISKNQDFWTL